MSSEKIPGCLGHIGASMLPPFAEFYVAHYGNPY